MQDNNTKTRVTFVPMDPFACGWYRIRNAFNALYCHEGIAATLNPVATFGGGADYIYTQRVCNESSFKVMEQLTNAGIKLVIDYDDDVWHPLPTYNKCAVHPEANYEGMKKYLDKVAYKVTCSTEFLKKQLTEFVPEDKIVVIPNCLDQRYWVRKFEPLGKGFLYAGSPTHYCKGDYGDFPKGLVDYLKDKIVRIQGIKPDFINASEIIPWTRIDYYHNTFLEAAQKSAFILAPLKDNDFNKCKSDLKYIESCAAGRVCLVSDVETFSLAHPYQKIPLEVTPTTMKFIVERASKNYQEILNYQYNILNTRWLRADKYLELFK